MNARDTIADALTDPDVPNDTRRLIAEHEADGALALLAERGFVVVACPPGSRVVVSRESKPCDECAGTGNRFYEVAEGFCDCIGCGGSGVVEATTTQAVKPFTVEDRTYTEDGTEASVRTTIFYSAVALPEDGE